jgi:hypothetical protein
LLDLIAEQLNQGVKNGELSQIIEADLRSEMLWDCYLANYRQAIYSKWCLDTLEAKSRDQIRIILAGAKRG